MVQLTAGVCSRLNEPEHAEDLLSSTPIVQILSVKRVGPTAGPNPVDRYRIIVSDGEHFLQSMLATQLNHLVDEGQIIKNTICRLDKFTCNMVQDKRLLIVLNMTVLEQSAMKMGSPQGLQIAPGDAAATPSTAHHTPAVNQPTPVVNPTRASSSTTTTPGAGAGRGQGARSGRAAIFPIEGLSPYQNNWTIRARVTNKSDMKSWSNQKGEGKLFNVTFMDETGEIRATAFNAVAETLYDKMEEGKVYYVSKAKVNLAKRQFSNLSNEYEISLERNTEIEECRDAGSFPAIRYNFVDLGKLQDLTKESFCDIIAVVKEVGEATEFTSKFNKTSLKRELTVVDQSGYSVRLTLWGKTAEKWNHTDQPIVAFKGLKVGDFGGRTLSMAGSSSYEVNPDIPESHGLRGWFDSVGSAASFQSHTNTFSGSGGAVNFNRAAMLSIEEVKTKDLGNGDKADFFSTRATVMHLKSDNIAYPACPNTGCSKKVFDQHDGWRCEKCDRSFEKPEYRYIISMAVSDYSGQAWFQGFNDLGEALFKRPANEVVAIKDSDDARYNKLVEEVNGQQFNFACRAKQDTYNETTRTRYGVQKILPLDYAEESRHLVELLSSPWAQ
ncbi:replication factor-a protein [Cristinia sonorae]|uniref:Replication protein A subunit n=1 Tax=Cristinia sonorae TaxID=1940300 RepID=A0A8K0XP48_9AGAR|nr:replication factor-a protein [Cristinia sonorae]